MPEPARHSSRNDVDYWSREATSPPKSIGNHRRNERSAITLTTPFALLLQQTFFSLPWHVVTKDFLTVGSFIFSKYNNNILWREILIRYLHTSIFFSFFFFNFLSFMYIVSILNFRDYISYYYSKYSLKLMITNDIVISFFFFINKFEIRKFVVLRFFLRLIYSASFINNINRSNAQPLITCKTGIKTRRIAGQIIDLTSLWTIRKRARFIGLVGWA